MLSKTLLKRKAQAMPLNVIIIAAVALIVLVILILIFKGKITKWNEGLGESEKELKKCSLPGTDRTCISDRSVCSGDILSGEFSDCTKSQICCEEY